MSMFDTVSPASRDPILGLNEQFQADAHLGKVNLAVGVYSDDAGCIPLLDCVAEAERHMLSANRPRCYLPIEGAAAYNRAVQLLVFGEENEALTARRVATVQGLGGTGGLKIGADFLKRVGPTAKVLISDPNWENHRAIFANAGFVVETYPYYDAINRGVNFPGMLAALKRACRGTVVVLHACCHNPTGYDMTVEQWSQVVEIISERGHIPYLDMAYQGFGAGIAEDGAAVQLFLDSGISFLVATSFSKSFSFYGERVGALSVVCASQDEAGRLLSRLKVAIRTNYSSPPVHGAQVVSTVLSSPTLRARWVEELGAMRVRIRTMRNALVDKLKEAGFTRDIEFVLRQNGMFSYTGLTPVQMQRLRNEFSIYGVDTGRICVAALNTGNLDRVVDAMVKVCQSGA